MSFWKKVGNLVDNSPRCSVEYGFFVLLGLMGYTAYKNPLLITTLAGVVAFILIWSIVKPKQSKAVETKEEPFDGNSNATQLSESLEQRRA